MASEELGNVNMTIRIMARRRKSVTSFWQRKNVDHLTVRVFSVLNKNTNASPFPVVYSTKLSAWPTPKQK
jgi:hypothetical protein